MFVIYVAKRRYRFKTLVAAKLEAERIFRTTGNVVGIFKSRVAGNGVRLADTRETEKPI